MRILSVVGARPQFVKLAPIAQALKGRAEHVILHTGQHYDELMSDVFFRDLGIPAPEVNLDVGSGSHGKQTGLMLEGLEREFKGGIRAVDGDVLGCSTRLGKLTRLGTVVGGLVARRAPEFGSTR